MKNITLEEHRCLQTEILVSFSEICEKHSLRYYLAYGTLIGAVRHKGFIPWDDDTDVHMPYPDYIKLIEIFNKENQNKNLVLKAPNDKGAFHTFVKIYDNRTIKIEEGIRYKNNYLGVDIDVFPLEGQPDDDVVFKEWQSELFKVYRALQYKSLRITKRNLHGMLSVSIRKLKYLRSKKYYLKKAEKLHAMYPYETSKYVGFVGTYFSYKNDRYKKTCFEEGTLLEYEGLKFKAPNDYDRVLSNIYGDYMQLPPEEKRVTHHANNVFWKE